MPIITDTVLSGIAPISGVFGTGALRSPKMKRRDFFPNLHVGRISEIPALSATLRRGALGARRGARTR